ncbi:hypothetical protein VUN82_12095 [Micrococcaceae bacterium Sec5.1]|uniref:hypothetical protein n=1 Tax=unclassified Paenarthrobacter TaxID=2634190 RepID=UPI00336770FE
MTVNRRRYVSCPCGILLDGVDDEELVIAVRAHLNESHPGLDYTRDQILLMAY